MADEFAKLDRSQSFASLHGDGRRAFFMQNDCFYDHAGKRCNADGSPLKAKKPRKAKAPEPEPEVVVDDGALVKEEAEPEAAEKPAPRSRGAKK